MNTLSNSKDKTAPWKTDHKFWLDLVGRSPPKTSLVANHQKDNVDARARVIKDGYYRQPAPERFSGSVKALKDIVEKLVELGFPPSFALLFDEAYEVWAEVSVEVCINLKRT